MADTVERRIQYVNDVTFEKVEASDTKYYLFFKRLLDIMGALCGIIIMIIPSIIIALLIKKEDSKGPVFFKQKRVGHNGQEFMMYKFRSMIVNAEEELDKLLEHNEVSGAMFKMKEDPRVTKIGRFIRKTSIDEFPQLINVLKGEMSLVGPRPPLPREVDEYTSYDKQRLVVKPGCTGLWQVSGRNNVGFEGMVDMDIRYIKTRGILKDIKIILLTFKEIVRSDSAA
ncbi:sugar transferase [Bacillus carboniphilus]